MHAALNVLELFTDDVINACIKFPSSEKHCVASDYEFGLENIG